MLGTRILSICKNIFSKARLELLNNHLCVCDNIDILMSHQIIALLIARLDILDRNGIKPQSPHDTLNRGRESMFEGIDVLGSRFWKCK